MPPITLSAGGFDATILPELGAGLADFSMLGAREWRYPLLRRAPWNPRLPQDLACFFMAPWTNRIRDARFNFRGQEHRLRATWRDGTAIHGDVWTRAWSVVDRSPVHARLEIDSRRETDVNFPFPFVCSVRYALEEGRLSIAAEVRNVGSSAMPAGLGWHPYFPRRLWAADERVEVQAPNAGRFPTEGCLPTDHARHDEASRRLDGGAPLENPKLDDVFDGFASPAVIRWPGSGVRLRMETSETLGKLVVFAPHDEGSGRAVEWFCVEPVSMINDGFNLMEQGWTETGVRVLEPGEVLKAGVAFRVEMETHGHGADGQ